MLTAGKGKFLKTGGAKPAVGNLVSTKQVVHGGRVSPSVGNCRTRRAVHKAKSLWSGQLSIRASCEPRRGAAVWLFGRDVYQGGAFAVKTQFSKVKAELPPARGGSSSPAVLLVSQGGAFAVKTQFSKGNAELPPARGALCPCPKCQGLRDYSHVASLLVTWVQSRTAEATASFQR